MEAKGDTENGFANIGEKISDKYADAVLEKGPMSVFMNECATGYQHSFHIRGLLAHYQATGNERWLKAAKEWSEFSIKMQGDLRASRRLQHGISLRRRERNPEKLVRGGYNRPGGWTA